MGFANNIMDKGWTQGYQKLLVGCDFGLFRYRNGPLDGMQNASHFPSQGIGGVAGVPGCAQTAFFPGKRPLVSASTFQNSKTPASSEGSCNFATGQK